MILSCKFLSEERMQRNILYTSISQERFLKVDKEREWCDLERNGI